MEACFEQGFDEYMNLVLDDAEEVNVKKNSRKQLGLYSYFDDLRLKFKIQTFYTRTIYLKCMLSLLLIRKDSFERGQHHIDDEYVCISSLVFLYMNTFFFVY